MNFKLPEGMLWRECETLLNELGFKRIHRVRLSRAYLDTFDRRLYRARQLLCEEKFPGRVVYSQHDAGATTAHHRISLKQPVRFAHDFPEGGFRTRLSELTGERALLAMVLHTGHMRAFQLADAAGKTSLLARLEEVRDITAAGIRRRIGQTRLRLEPVRGYQSVFDSIEQSLRKVGFTACDPLPLSPDPLEPSQPPRQEPGTICNTATRADVYIKLGLASYLEAILHNRTGVIHDVDIECLHDLRVAVRRTRSVLKLCKQVFPETSRRRFKREFAWVARQTSALRDLDVTLSDLRDAPPDDVAAIKLREALRHQRTRAHSKVVKMLEGRRFERLMENFGQFLKSPVPQTTRLSCAELAHTKVGGEKILHTYQRLRRLGKTLSEESTDEAFHSFRKRIKVLRYQLDFFRTAFDRKKVKPAIKIVEKTQKIFGEFQDLCFREQVLKQLQSTVSTHTPGLQDTLTSVARRKNAVRAQCLAAVVDNLTRASAKRYQALVDERA